MKLLQPTIIVTIGTLLCLLLVMTFEAGADMKSVVQVSAVVAGSCSFGGWAGMDRVKPLLSCTKGVEIRTTADHQVIRQGQEVSAGGMRQGGNSPMDAAVDPSRINRTIITILP